MECSFVTFYEKNKIIKTTKHRNKVLNKAIGLHGFPWGKIFNARLFLNVHFPEQYWFEDTIMSFVIFPMCKKVITSESVLYRYRINPNGITSVSIGKPKSIDSFYITEKLIKDREILGLVNDIDFSRRMLHQIKINYFRIKTLGNKDIDYAVFLLTVRLWEQYFLFMHTNRMTKALKNKDFGEYKLICEWYLK